MGWEDGPVIGSSYVSVDELIFNIDEGDDLGSSVLSYVVSKYEKFNGSTDGISKRQEDGTSLGPSDRSADELKLVYVMISHSHVNYWVVVFISLGMFHDVFINGTTEKNLIRNIPMTWGLCVNWESDSIMTWGRYQK